MPQSQNVTLASPVNFLQSSTQLLHTLTESSLAIINSAGTTLTSSNAKIINVLIQQHMLVVLARTKGVAGGTATYQQAVETWPLHGLKIEINYRF